MSSVVTDFFDSLKEFSSSPWFYLIIYVIAVLDSILPVVPSETLVIIGGVSAGLGDLSIIFVVLTAGLGAFTGDNMSYLIGRRASGGITRRYERTEKGRRRLQTVIEQIHERGGLLLITARFIPGGRTILTLSCGITRQDRRWYMGWIAAAASIWALYASLLGFIGGKTFEENHTLAFVVAFVTAVSVTVLIEVIRALLKKIRSRTS
ncbi:MAG: DedA family protein [Ilumatobacteraceae bacterium]